MDYTKHYHLPQWEKADRIMMEDFNRMCADIEDGLNRNAEAAAGALKTAGNCSKYGKWFRTNCPNGTLSW